MSYRYFRRLGMGRKRRQSGQSSTEFAIGCALLTTFLFVDSPVGKLLAQAVRDFYRTLTFYLSLP
jgi:hypothetical protein